MAKKNEKSLINSTNKNISELITELNFQNLSNEFLDEMEQIMKLEDVNERQRARMKLSKNVYSTIFSEMINRILFSPDFIKDIEELPIKERLQLMMQLAKYNYDELKRENEKLMNENERIQIIINQDNQVHQAKKTLFEDMYLRYSHEQKLEMLNQVLDEETNSSNNDVQVIDDIKKEE